MNSNSLKPLPCLEECVRPFEGETDQEDKSKQSYFDKILRQDQYLLLALWIPCLESETAPKELGL